MDILELVYWAFGATGIFLSGQGLSGLRPGKNVDRVWCLMKPLSEYDLAPSGGLADLVADRLEADWHLGLGALFLIASFIVSAARDYTSIYHIQLAAGCYHALIRIGSVLAGVFAGAGIKSIVRRRTADAAERTQVSR